jgi:hypothetical protein
MFSIQCSATDRQMAIGSLVRDSNLLPDVRSTLGTSEEGAFGE